jgi:Big-like domain-containing protein
VNRWPVLIASALAVGCSNLTEGAGGVVELEIREPAVTQIAVGGTLQLLARALDRDGNPVTVPITWQSANATLTVNDQGLVTGVAPGTGQVQAFAGSLASTPVALTIVAAAVSGLRIDSFQ